MDDENTEDVVTDELPVAEVLSEAMMPVKLLARREQSALVQWLDRGEINRGYVPASSIEDDMVNTTDLELAIPYGLPWAGLITLNATPEKLAHELRRVGIWTYDDLVKNGQGAIGAIQRVYGIDYGRLKQAALEFTIGE